MAVSEFLSKRILITGASNGIGAGLAKAFAKRGASLSIVGRNETNLKEVARECKELGAKKILPIVADLAIIKDVERVVKETLASFEGLDILINNAGLGWPTPVAETKVSDFDFIFAVNTRAPVILTKLVVPHLEQSKGNIINVSSVVTEVNLSELNVYSMSKAALNKFTKTAALELAKTGIRVNAVNPAFVKTNVNRYLDENTARELEKNVGMLHPLGRREVSIDEVVNAVLFLASNDARMITGTCLMADRGFVLAGGRL
ncbi:L-xylulose reductase-like [Clavelina lepadiformis]|uniref:Uncharacterized protein n=1 Tax=Clavelina lepadiformis TaxID=159417 RepID=A0ABP0GB75_CLALP